MAVFFTTLNQTVILLLFILAGYILARCKAVPENAASVLSNLENNFLVPAMIVETFIRNFTADKLTVARDLLLCSFLVTLVFIFIGVFCARFCSKDRYERNIFAFGLSFSNFGFMGNAVVRALFPDIFLEYLLFTLPLWALLFGWGVPVLLMDDGEKKSLAQRAKQFVNPMFVSTLLGMFLGLSGIPVPDAITSVVSSAGSCMTPVAMLLTGMIIAGFELRSILNIRGIYIATALRLLVFPALFLVFLKAVPLPETLAICTVCALAMPLGLSAIITPSALGKDTRAAAGMVLVSHVLSCFTIPLILAVYTLMI